MRYFFFVFVPRWICLAVPPALRTLWSELDVSFLSVYDQILTFQDDPLNMWKRRNKPKQLPGPLSAKDEKETAKGDYKEPPTPPPTLYLFFLLK